MPLFNYNSHFIRVEMQKSSDARSYGARAKKSASQEIKGAKLHYFFVYIYMCLTQYSKFTTRRCTHTGPIQNYFASLSF